MGQRVPQITISYSKGLQNTHGNQESDFIYTTHPSPVVKGTAKSLFKYQLKLNKCNGKWKQDGSSKLSMPYPSVSSLLHESIYI